MNEADYIKPDHSTELAEQRTEFAMQRTIIAEERTLMAWIRTSISMIGFGFTIYKFLQYLRESESVSGIIHHHSARNLGLTLIALGIFSLIAAMVQHRVFLNRIGAKEGKHLWSLSFIVAMFMVLIGVLAFIGVLTGAGPY